MFSAPSAADKTQKCYHQRKPMVFLNCRTSNSADDNDIDFMLQMFPYNTKLSKLKICMCVWEYTHKYIKQIWLSSSQIWVQNHFEFDSSTQNMIWGTAYMLRCNEFCNNQTYLTSVYSGIGTEVEALSSNLWCSKGLYGSIGKYSQQQTKVWDIILKTTSISSCHIRRLNRRI